MEERSSPIQKLSTELLVKILNYVKYIGSIGSLYNCLRCCHQWRDLGLPFLYEDIALVNKETARRFCRARSIFSRRLSLLQSLTVGLESIPFDEKGPEMFAGALIRLSNLRTLSIVSLYYISAATTLLRALPQSVENLELNFGKKCRASYLKEHLCDQIRPHLKTVKRLRLRNNTVCASLFVDRDDWTKRENHSALALESVVITSWQDEPFRWCGSEDEAAIPLMPLCIRAFSLSGVFPRGKEFHINWLVCSKNGPDKGLNMQLFHHDMLRGWQETFSVVRMSKLSPEFSDFVIAGREQRMLYGNENDLISYVEGEVGFLRTSLGLRFPAAISLKKDCCLKKSSFRPVDKILEDGSSPRSFRAALEVLDIPFVVKERPHLDSIRKYPQEHWTLAQYMIELCENGQG